MRTSAMGPGCELPGNRSRSPATHALQPRRYPPPRYPRIGPWGADQSGLSRYKKKTNSEKSVQ